MSKHLKKSKKYEKIIKNIEKPGKNRQKCVETLIKMSKMSKNFGKKLQKYKNRKKY